MSTLPSTIYGNTGPLGPPPSSQAARASAGAQQGGGQFSTLLSNFTPPPSRPVAAAPASSPSARQEQVLADKQTEANRDLARNAHSRKLVQQQEARQAAARAGGSGGPSLSDRVGRSTQPTPAYPGSPQQALAGDADADKTTKVRGLPRDDADKALEANDTSSPALASKQTSQQDLPDKTAATPDPATASYWRGEDGQAARPFGAKPDDGDTAKSEQGGAKGGELLSPPRARKGAANSSEPRESANPGQAANCRAELPQTALQATPSAEPPSALFIQALQDAKAIASPHSPQSPMADPATAATAALAAPGTATSPVATPESTPFGGSPLVLPQPLHSPAFAPEMAARLSVLAAEGVQEARLHLNPAEMGPVGVQIVVDGQLAQISFHAENAETRAVLERSLPDLAAALRDNGLTLSGGGVFQQQMSQQDQAPTESGNQARHGSQQADPSQPPLDAGSAAKQARPRSSQGVVDLYA